MDDIIIGQFYRVKTSPEVLWLVVCFNGAHPWPIEMRRSDDSDYTHIGHFDRKYVREEMDLMVVVSASELHALRTRSTRESMARHVHTGSCANGADCGFATIIDNDTLARLRAKAKRLQRENTRLQTLLDLTRSAPSLSGRKSIGFGRNGSDLPAREGNPVFCEHANEVPQACPCTPSCYCKDHTCQGRRR